MPQNYYHTVEGGAVFTKNPDTLKKMAYMRNFGHDGPERFAGVGINGKNSEFHAAMGIVNLRYVDEILNTRKRLSQQYDNLLKKLNVLKPKITPDSDYNFSYYPVIFENEKITLKMKRFS